MLSEPASTETLDIPSSYRPAPPKRRHRGVWSDKLADENEAVVPWVWEGYLARGDLWHLRQEERIDLFVVDPLSAFLPRGSENLADRLLESLRPLERLTGDGAAVLLLHHPKKGDVLAGQAARGSGALCAYADVLLEMHWAARDKRDDRRRRLSAAIEPRRADPLQRRVGRCQSDADRRSCVRVG